MNEALIKSYQNRIVNANRKELLLVNYEIIMTEIEEAIKALDDNVDKSFDQAMVNAHKFLRELSDNLDIVYDISKNLMSIYIYINKRMIDASMRYDKEALYEVKEILNILLIGWRQAEESPYSQTPVVANSQKVYAGLTYGKGSLNEMVFEEAGARGFKA